MIDVQQGTPDCDAPIGYFAQRSRAEKNKSIFLGLNAVKIILGLIACVLDVVALEDRLMHWYLMTSYPEFPHLGTGIWCGMIMVISGIMRVLACYFFTPTKCFVTANITISTLAVVLLLIATCIAAVLLPASQRMWYALLTLTAIVGVIISIIDCCCSCTNMSAPRKCEGAVIYTSVAHQATPIQLHNSEVTYYPSLPISSQNLCSTDVGMALLPLARSNIDRHPQHVQPLIQTASQWEHNANVSSAYNSIDFLHVGGPTSRVFLASA